MVGVVVLAPQCGLATVGLSARRSVDVGGIASCLRSFVSGSRGGRLAVSDFGLKGGNASGLKSKRRGNNVGGIRGALFLFLQKKKDKEVVKKELLEAIAPLDRGATTTAEDAALVDKIAQELEALNPTKEPLLLPFLNGKWELLYTTSSSILKKERPKLLRPNGAIYQAINTDILRAQNLETWPNSPHTKQSSCRHFQPHHKIPSTIVSFIASFMQPQAKLQTRQGGMRLANRQGMEMTSQNSS